MDRIVTTVRLPSDLHEALRRRAFEERRPVADLIREAVRRLLQTPIAPGSLPSLQDDPLWKLVGSVDGGSRDESVEHDHYLYGSSKRNR